MRKIGNITAFFGAEDVFSNWHPSPFEYHGIPFSCVEQFMMYSKAKLFADEGSARSILASQDPQEKKALGRRVRGFKEDLWVERRESIVFVGCREKFTQNPAMKAELLETAPTELVEASLYDTIWGIGLSMHDSRIGDRRHWRGLNLLGKTLTRLREAFLQI